MGFFSRTFDTYEGARDHRIDELRRLAARGDADALIALAAYDSSDKDVVDDGWLNMSGMPDFRERWSGWGG